MTDLNVQNQLKGFFLVCFSLLFFNCNEKNNSPSSSSQLEQDSVRIWIAQSKLKEVDELSKSKLLNKANIRIRAIKNDSIKCKYYSELSLRSMRSNDSILFRKVNFTGLEHSKKTNDSICRANLLWDLGDFFENHAIRDSAYYHYTEANKIFTNLGDNFSSGRVLSAMATVQNNIGDYTGSEITTIKAIEKIKPLNKYRQLAGCYNNLGDVTKLLNNYNRSLQYYEQALIYIRKADLGALREQSHKNNVALVYQMMGQHQRAITYFSEVVNFDSVRYKDPKLYARTLNNLGYSYLKLNKTEQLPSLFEQAFKIQDSIGDIAGKASSTYRVAEYLLAQKDTAGALIHLKESQKYAQQASSNKKILEVLRLFSRADPKNAVTYARDYFALSDSLQNQERQLREKFARISFETDEFIAENQLLARQRQLWSGIAFAILLLSIAAFVIISQRSKNQKLRFQQEQQARNQEIFNLMLTQSEKLEEGKQMEQKRISEELHDGVQGRLQGARMMLLGLNKRDDEKAVNERARAIIMLKDVQEEVRAISHELSHAAYQKIHNFILSLEDLKTTIAKSADIEINFEYAEQLDWDALNSDIKINMYRIIQESLQNAVKHAQCTKIDLSLEVNASHLTVNIIDNGSGFIVKKGKKGIGMRNITSRMKKVHGTWDITSDIGVGTKVTLIIPIVESDKIEIVTSESNNLQKV